MKTKNITELENFIKSSCIDSDYHSKVFEFKESNVLNSKINLELFNKKRYQIYWLSSTLYKISFVNYFRTIESSGKLSIRKENLLIFHPFSTIASEMCKLLISDFIYSALSSILCRQMIEQICLIREIEIEKIEEKLIIEACIESHNMHVGAKSLNIRGLNVDNNGILKVFNNKASFGKLAKKYNYGFMYNFFSGDVHTQAPIDKLIPTSLNKKSKYNEIYLDCILSLVNDCLKIVERYDKTNADLSVLEKIKFINITG